MNAEEKRRVFDLATEAIQRAKCLHSDAAVLAFDAPADREQYLVNQLLGELNGLRAKLTEIALAIQENKR